MPAAGRRRWTKAWMGLALGAFLLIQYGDALRMPFVNDDFLFLDHTRVASPQELLAPNVLVSRYYRPWSRELHFWALQALFGADPVPFHVTNLLLCWAGLFTFFLLATEIAGAAVAVVATAGAALVTGWATPVLWAAGSQDLWMLAAGLGFLWCFTHGHRMISFALLAISLLSKETAIVFPAIATARELIVGRRSPRDTLRALWPSWLVVTAWAALHPMILGAALQRAGLSESSPAADSRMTSLLHAILSLVNLDLWPRPVQGFGFALVTALPGLLVWGVLIGWLLAGRRDTPVGGSSVPAARIVAWGAVGWGLGWLPAVLSGVGFHNYYGLVGQLFGWLALGVLLAPRRALALGVIVAVGFLRSANAQTGLAVLGNEWNHRRLATLTQRMQDDLQRLEPTMHANTRIYFGDVPWGLGLITSHPDSPALRVWYRDGTLSGGFYSTYRPRAAGKPPGQDLFFLFDRDNGRLVEVRSGPEPLEVGRPPSARWEADHMFLAQRFSVSGDPMASAMEWRKLLTVFPGRAEYVRELAAELDRAREARERTANPPSPPR